MTDIDRDALLAAMYDNEPEEKPTGRPIPTEDAFGNGMRKTRKIIMGAVAITVPSVEYVESLEQKILTQERAIDEMQRNIRRIESSLHQVRQYSRMQSNTISGLSNDIQNKVDRLDR